MFTFGDGKEGKATDAARGVGKVGKATDAARCGGGGKVGNAFINVDERATPTGAEESRTGDLRSTPTFSDDCDSGELCTTTGRAFEEPAGARARWGVKTRADADEDTAPFFIFK